MYGQLKRIIMTDMVERFNKLTILLGIRIFILIYNVVT